MLSRVLQEHSGTKPLLLLMGLLVPAWFIFYVQNPDCIRSSFGYLFSQDCVSHYIHSELINVHIFVSYVVHVTNDVIPNMLYA